MSASQLPCAAVSRRIEIELTSKLSDAEWTWRAAGAKQPKGTLEATVLYEGAKAGDVVRAEADFEVDGITITSVAPPQGKRAEPENRLVVTGSSKKFEPVISTLAPKRGRGERGDRGDRASRPRGGKDGERRGGKRRDENRRKEGEGAEGARRSRSARSPRREAPTFRKLTPKDTNRKRVLETVPVEQRPIAEKVLRGGIPSVRQAIDAENAKAREEKRPEINGPALLSLAEELLPRLKAAEWMDRAEAAKEIIDEIGMRDLRAVVGSADAVARTEETRMLAAELREALERRTVQSRTQWTENLTSALDEGRIVRALHLSSRPPDPEFKFPAELLERLKNDAGAAMAPDAPKDRWKALIEAVAESPVRRTVEPAGFPSDAGEELTNEAKQLSGRIPALAKLLGVTMPPPPRRIPPKPAAPKPAGGEQAPAQDKPETPSEAKTESE